MTEYIFTVELSDSDGTTLWSANIGIDITTTLKVASGYGGRIVRTDEE